tara:strand:- start:3730 stop:4233 length:504 start_codon:yes stop_codon:yes gene_type:complete
MSSYSENTLNIFMNPIDEIEEIIAAYNLNFFRNDKNEISILFEGLWSIYELKFNWSKNNGLIKINNDLNIKIPKKSLVGIYKLLSLINEQTLLGFFGYSSRRSCLFFRHNVSIKGVKFLATEQIEDFIDSIVQECDKFYPAFQTLIYKNEKPQQSINNAIFETIGEA